MLYVKIIKNITTKYRFTSSVLRHKFFGIFSISNVRLISRLSCVNLKSTENLLINKIDNGNRKNANDMCAHKKLESASKFPKVVCSKSVSFPARLPTIQHQ